MRRNILVTCSTGKQGAALVRALLYPSPNNSDAPIQSAEYHVYALTRNASSTAAKSLFGEEDNVTVVQGDLDDSNSIRQIFEDTKGDSGIWGVYAVLAYPGLGAVADGEERQGKMLADLALEYRVQAFIYSSAARAGPQYESQLKLSGQAKSRVEQYCMALGDKGLPWTIMRPGFFMENFDDFIGSIAVGVMKNGLKETTTIGLIASEDIGNVAAGVFRDTERFRNRILVLFADFLTMTQLGDSYQRALGQPIPSVPKPFSWFITKFNHSTQELIEDLELNHRVRNEDAAEYPTLPSEIRAANEAYKMRTYYQWLISGEKQKAEKDGWNQVSLGKLLTGRS